MTPSALARVLPLLINKRRPAFIWGPPGGGKSAVVRQICESMKLEMRDIRLSLLDPTDLKGLPFPDVKAKVMRWLQAEFLPQDQKSKGVLFFDELNAAPQSVQAATYQLILDHQIGEYVLPPGWSMLAAGNRSGDRGVVHTMPSPLANRLVHIDFEVSNNDWDVKAQADGISVDLRAFMKFRPKLLTTTDMTNNPRAFPTPRSWYFVDDFYKAGLNHEDEFELIKGTVGEGAATEFLAYIKQIKDLPTVDQVLLDPEATKLPERPAGKYAMVTALDEKATPNNFGRIMKYVERMDKEFQVIFVRACARANDKICNTKEYMNWGTANADVLL